MEAVRVCAQAIVFVPRTGTHECMGILNGSLSFNTQSQRPFWWSDSPHFRAGTNIRTRIQLSSGREPTRDGHKPKGIHSFDEWLCRGEYSMCIAKVSPHACWWPPTHTNKHAEYADAYDDQRRDGITVAETSTAIRHTHTHVRYQQGSAEGSLTCNLSAIWAFVQQQPTTGGGGRWMCISSHSLQSLRFTGREARIRLDKIARSYA